MVLALNTTTGLIADVPPHFLAHDLLKEVLVAVDEDAKPYVPELYKGGTKEEKAASRNTPEDIAPIDETTTKDKI
jgi:hypothetical protein